MTGRNAAVGCRVSDGVRPAPAPLGQPSPAGAGEGRTGSVTSIQRFGSALNLNLHFHCIFADGVYTRGADDRLSFRRVVPHAEDVERLVASIAEACEAWLSQQGFGFEDEGDAEEDDAQAVPQQASLLGLMALTRLNWSSADFACAKPITLAFARRVGLILGELPDDIQPRPYHRFYM